MTDEEFIEAVQKKLPMASVEIFILNDIKQHIVEYGGFRNIILEPTITTLETLLEVAQMKVNHINTIGS